MIADPAMELLVTARFRPRDRRGGRGGRRSSEKTVFNYFPAKEDLFFDEMRERKEALPSDLRGRGSGESMPRPFGGSSRGDAPALQPNFAHLRAPHRGVARAAGQGARGDGAVHTGAHRQQFTASSASTNATRGSQRACWSEYTGSSSGAARKQALAGKHGPAAVRRLRADLKRGGSSSTGSVN